ncbi:Phage terminase, large subunit GpA [Marinobacterium lutimaris]|uniref:Phage terminase, large subunit GpA n=1 Tax=Marinobacterium lutimaris TaxID=568106 RepID=A0A1H5XTY2_9GAMM|nr:Phage terminase, large subunit GpA [Marinobacterium lutimaris]
MISRALEKLLPPRQMSTADWANEYRWMAAEQTASPGKYTTDLTPWVPGMLNALDDDYIRKVVCMKSAQVAWTDGVWNNYLAKRIHLDPCGVVLLFPKEKTIRKYLDQKFDPTVRATPVLRDLIDVETSRSAGNRMDFKRFPGGFLALVASNAPDNVKSLSAPVVAVEEPDDCSSDVRGQGDSVDLLEQRAKTYENRKVIFGGTPTVKGLSRVEDAYKKSDQRKFWVPCHECGERHVLTWANVVWDEDPDRHDEVYGSADPDSAAYVCPHCAVEWTDRQKNLNVRQGEWIADKPGGDTAGFYINELYSPFPGSKLNVLVRRYLEAQHALEWGDESKMIGFTNNTLGLPYEYASDAPDVEKLSQRAEAYAEKTVPNGGLILTAGVDVQHDRLAITIWAHGRGEENWLVYWGEIAAVGNTADRNDPVWTELDQILFGTYQHEKGWALRIRAADLDSGDGQTNDAVYHYVRSRANRGVKLRAIKGANSIDAEIVTAPKKVDVSKMNKAAKYGLQVWIVGVNKVKDLMAARMKLTGNGAGRMHWYTEVRSDFYDQMTGEIKAPSRTQRGKLIWQQKAGSRVEAWDCTGYAIHAARAERLHLLSPAQWDAIEADLAQGDMFSAEPEQPAVVEEQQAQPKPQPQQKRRARGNALGGWLNRE